MPDPTQPGPYHVISATAEITDSTTSDTFPVLYDYPITNPLSDAGAPPPQGCPIVLFAHGFLMDASAYETYANHLASFGYVVVLPNYYDANTILSMSNDVAYMQDVVTGLTFATGGLPQSDPAVTPLVSATGPVGISGHSLGGKLAILAIEQNRGLFKASIDFDPIDDTSCGANCPSVLPGLGGLGVPTAFLGETTDSSGFGACAPTAENFQAFYAAAGSPSLLGTVPAAGSASFVDNQSNCGVGCSLCSAGNAGPTLSLAHGLMVAFYERHLRNKTGYDAWLATAGSVGSLARSTWVTPGTATFSSK